MEQKDRDEEKGGRLRKLMKILFRVTLVVIIILGVLFITGKVLTGRLETETNPRAQESWGPGTSFIDTRSGFVHILDIGEGDVILLIHGSSGSLADWQDGVAYQLAKSYRVVAFDSYGFGLSERNDSFKYGHSLWVTQAIDVLNALGIERVVVVGHSAGAMTAVALAADYPERVSGVVITGHGLSVDLGQMFPLLPGLGEFLQAQSDVAGATFSDSNQEKAVIANSIAGTRAAFLAFIRSQYTSPFSLRFLNGMYEDIQVPVLQMHGTLDESQDIESAKDLSSRIADSRFVAIEGSGHFVHIDAPDQWVNELIFFVESLGP